MGDELLQKLRQLLPPPSQPTHNRGNWNAVEANLGATLPDDYKAFICDYGTGCIDNFLYVYNYFEETDTARKDLQHLAHLRDNVLGELLHVAELLGRDRKTVVSPVPYPLYPEPNGLFPWGKAQDGWTFWWLRNVDPSDWGILVTYNWVEKHYEFPQTAMVEFLIGLLRTPFDQRLRIDPVFEPISPR